MIEHKRSTLLTSEDWWAVWFGLVIIVVAVAGLVTGIPKIGKWTDNPLDAFLVIKRGAAAGTILFQLILLYLGLGVLTSVGVAVMGGRLKDYLPGYTVVFLFSIIAYTL